MACKINKRIENREITFDEFRKQKGSQPYKNYRQTAKSLNFLLIFGGSPSVFSQSALETSWTLKQVEEYLKENKCDKELEQAKKIYKNMDTAHQKYIAAAMRMREKFFEGYGGLLDRCDREVKYAEEHGFCRSVFGMTRNFIELMLKGEDDEKLLSARMRNISNQAKNVKMQNYEACVRGRAMREIQEWLEKNNFKTKVWNEIHDSTDFWIYKSELKTVLPHIKHVEERIIPELEATWSPLPVDCEISDLTSDSHNYYKGGASPEAYGITWDWNLQYEDIDPFGVELSDSLERTYFEKRKLYWENIKKEKDPLQEKIEKYLKEKTSS